MGILDIIILICFIPAIYNGMKNGLIGQLATIVTILLGTWLSFRLSRPLSLQLSDVLAVSTAVRDILAFVITFLVTAFLLMLMGKAAMKVVKLVMPGWLDKLLGIAFSMLNCMLVLGLMVLAFNNINEHLHLVEQQTLDSSVFYNPLKNFACTVFPYFKRLL